jgi:hypothetical protein
MEFSTGTFAYVRLSPARGKPLKDTDSMNGAASTAGCEGGGDFSGRSRK